MDESVAVNGDLRGAVVRERDHRGGVVLPDAGLRGRGLHADPAGSFSAFDARGSARDRLPVLSQRGGTVVVFECAGSEHVHELP